MPHYVITCSDVELIAQVKSAVVTERHATAALIALLAELEERQLFLREGCSTMFKYCTEVLRLSEHAAYLRIGAARASRRWPAILPLLTTGDINLTTIKLLAPCLTEENHDALLEAARGRSKAEIENLIAALHPQPDIESRIRRLPVPAVLQSSAPNSNPPSESLLDMSTGEPSQPPRQLTPPPSRPVVAPLSPERYLIKVTVGADAHANLKRARDLLRHTIPSGDPAAIVERALALLVEQLERTKHARVARPNSTSTTSAMPTRHVPAAVRREVWRRDSGRCTFVGTAGRCTETGFLEFHHVVPFAAGGATDAENLQLRCRAHNAYEAECYFGERPVLDFELAGA